MLLPLDSGAGPSVRFCFVLFSLHPATFLFRGCLFQDVAAPGGLSRVADEAFFFVFLFFLSVEVESLLLEIYSLGYAVDWVLNHRRSSCCDSDW